MKKSTLMVVAAVSVPVMAATTGVPRWPRRTGDGDHHRDGGPLPGPVEFGGKIPKITIEATEVSAHSPR